MRVTAIAAARSALSAAVLTMGLLTAPGARAETILVGDEISVRDSKLARPAPGITMKEVEAQFGAPQERHPSVGNPPITRWDYAGFSVFFEHDRVIHAVVVPAQSPAASTTTASAPAEAPAISGVGTAASDITAATTETTTASSELDAAIDATRHRAPSSAATADTASSADTSTSKPDHP